MDFQALQIELNARLHGNISNAAFLVQLKTWLNLARKYIVALNPDWDFLQTTTVEALIANQINYVLNTDIVKINQDEIILTASRKVLELPDVQKAGDPDITPGTPTHYRLAGYQQIQLLPPPNAAAVTAEVSITYEYSKTFPTDLVANADTHGLPVHLEPALLDIAEVMGWLYLRQAQASQSAWGRALSTLQALAPETELFSRFALNIQSEDVLERQGR